MRNVKETCSSVSSTKFGKAQTTHNGQRFAHSRIELQSLAFSTGEIVHESRKCSTGLRMIQRPPITMPHLMASGLHLFPGRERKPLKVGENRHFQTKHGVTVIAWETCELATQEHIGIRWSSA